MAGNLAVSTLAQALRSNIVDCGWLYAASCAYLSVAKFQVHATLRELKPDGRVDQSAKRWIHHALGYAWCASIRLVDPLCLIHPTTRPFRRRNANRFPPLQSGGLGKGQIGGHCVTNNGKSHQLHTRR